MHNDKSFWFMNAFHNGTHASNTGCAVNTFQLCSILCQCQWVRQTRTQAKQSIQSPVVGVNFACRSLQFLCHHSHRNHIFFLLYHSCLWLLVLPPALRFMVVATTIEFYPALHL